MTNQEVFDKCMTHLFTQRKRAIKHGSCRYRFVAEDGKVLRCAAGCFIDDNEYDPDFEGARIGLSITKEFGAYSKCVKLDNLFSKKGIDLNLMNVLQNVHDMNPECHWKENFSKVADNYSLNSSILGTFEDIV